MEAGTGEAMAQELGLGEGKLSFAQANRQAMDTAQLQDVSVMLNMRSRGYHQCKQNSKVNYLVSDPSSVGRCYRRF